MRLSVVVLVKFLVFSSAALASQPGRPIDCSDWEFFDPALRCTMYQEYNVPWPRGQVWRQAVSSAALDNLGRTLRVFVINPGGSICHSTIEIVAFDGTSETLLGRLSSRRGDDANTLHDCLHGPGFIGFDPIAGRLLVGLRSLCMDGYDYDSVTCPDDYSEIRYGVPNEPLGDWTAAIEGFTTLFDILESYTPATGSLGFSVPQRPEGLRITDRFDTYWGNVTRPLDLSQAHPLQCAYPNHQPQVGEYLTYPDAAPTPAPGQAVYYLTSVTYQGQTRAGRKALDGRLTGRDASQLPACVTEQEIMR